MTVSAAQEFRAKGSALAKARTEGFSGLYFGICSTLSTRVRIEVFQNDPYNFNTGLGILFIF